MFDKLTILGVLFVVASSAAWVDVVSNWNDPGPRETQHGPTLQIPQGLIRGEVEFYDGFRSHISYKGIPYAQGQSMLLIVFVDYSFVFRYQRPLETFVGALRFLLVVGMGFDLVRCSVHRVRSLDRL
jgi:hypothetical protein